MKSWVKGFGFKDMKGVRVKGLNLGLGFGFD